MGIADNGGAPVRGGRRMPALLRRSFLPWLVFALVAVAGILARAAFVTYNLPVAAHLDERPGLVLLYRLSHTSLNPDFFHYPTFYYYVTLLLTRPFPDIIVAGRALNLVFVAGTGLFAFLLARALGSHWAGVAAAVFLFLSPIILRNGSYIITDMLMMMLVLAALLAFARYFRKGGNGAWFVGIAAAGLATSTKYTAIILLVAYFIVELLAGSGTPSARSRANGLDRRLPFVLLPLISVLAALVALAVYLFVPQASYLSLLQAGAGVNSVVDASDLEFVGRMRAFLLITTSVLLLSLPFQLRFRALFARLLRVRPYAALILAAIFFFLGTPFALVSWQRFLYDFGYQLKQNQTGPEPYLRLYTIWYRAYESSLVLVLALVGGAAATWRARVKREGNARLLAVVGLYFLLYAISIATARRGYARYLTPLLPILYVFAGLGLVFLARLISRRWRWPAAVLLVMAVFGVVFIELAPPFLAFRSSVQRPEETYQSYHFILDAGVDDILYAGFVAPYFELEQAGLDVRQIPDAWLQSEDSPLLREMGANEFLLVDRTGMKLLVPDLRAHLDLLWYTEDGMGQYVLQLDPS